MRRFTRMHRSPISRASRTIRLAFLIAFALALIAAAQPATGSQAASIRSQATSTAPCHPQLLVISPLGCSEAAAIGAASLPSGFQESIVFSGLTEPTAVRFASDGRVFVAEKRGVIKVFDSLADTTPTVFADLNVNVYNRWDRGLLGLALNPNFPTTPYLYALYAHDAAIGGTAPRWGTPGVYSDPCPAPPGDTADGCVISGRLSRLQANGNLMTGSEQVLIEDWCQQYPSHSIGDLAFGPDGALYVSGGDGASFNFVDYGQDGNPLNPCGDPPVPIGGMQTPPTAEGGALRSESLQRTSGEPVVLNGAILRVDPVTGAALPGNPLFSSADPNARRIIAYGLRNPFRFTFRPGTSEIWVGDVGWGAWEEVDRIAATGDAVVENFSWPCYEGAGRQSGFDSTNLSICETLYAAPSGVTAPFYTYNHSAQVVAGESCPTGSSSITGLAFYNEGTYPSSYNGALFFADYSRNCIWVMSQRSGAPDPATLATFIAGAAGPVDLQIGPGGDLYYVDIRGGTIRRIQYANANQPPAAVIVANPTSGPAPLTVSFDGTGSSDPDPGDAITAYAWDLDGDGAYDDSTSPTPNYTYSAGNYTIGLKVTDKHAASGTTSTAISANNTAPTATINTPSASTTWKVGDVISFSGSATDSQDGPLPASALTWSMILNHCPSNCHTHNLQTFTGVASGSFSAPDHEYPSYLVLQLTATDSGGLQSTTSVQLNPQTMGLSFQSSPSGLQLAVNSASAATPFNRTVIAGSTNSVSAPSPQDLGAVRYVFNSWSDGGLQSHSIVANTPAVYSAAYVATSTDLAIVKTGTLASDKTTITFDLRTTNNGPTNAQNVVVTDALSDKVQYVSSSTPQGSCAYNSSTRVVTCSIGTMNAGAVVTPRITATVVKRSGFIDNTASVSSSTADLNSGNNTSTARIKLR